MHELRADGINFDIFRIVYVDELLVDVGTVGTRMVQIRIQFAGFVADLTSANGRQFSVMTNRSAYTHLSEEPSTTTSSEINVHVVVLATNRLFYKRLLHNFIIDNNSVSVFT